jgi:hypothetical protein
MVGVSLPRDAHLTFTYTEIEFSLAKNKHQISGFRHAIFEPCRCISSCFDVDPALKGHTVDIPRSASRCAIP